MPMEWCSHPVVRRESTEVGCKLSHPRGERRVDGQLARFISEYVQSAYPAVKRLNCIFSDGAPQHFRNHKNILNLTYHETDFGIPASWSFNATVHGKGAVGGIGAAVKSRGAKKVLSGIAVDAILTLEDLYKFVQKDSSMNVFYLNEKRIKSKGEKYQSS
jgi:hypothetical protein